MTPQYRVPSYMQGGDEANRGGLPDKQEFFNLLKKVQQDYRDGASFQDSSFIIRKASKAFQLNASEENEVVNHVLGTTFNTDTMFTGTPSNVSELAQSYIPVNFSDYISQVAEGTPKQLETFGPAARQSLAGIRLSMGMEDPDSEYMKERYPELQNQMVMTEAQKMLTPDYIPDDLMLEASEGLQNFVTENASALKNKLSKYGQEFLNWGRENLTFDMGGVDPESQRLAQIERARQDLLARPDYRQRLAQVLSLIHISEPTRPY